MSALSPSLFTNSNAIEPSEQPTRMDTAESTSVKDFLPISNQDEHIDDGFHDSHIQNATGDETAQQQPHPVCAIVSFY